MQKLQILFIFLSFSFVISASTVSGRIIDSGNNGMPFVTIAVLDKDTTLLGGSITDDDGSFSVDIPSAATLLRISFMGFQTQVLSLPLSDKILIRMSEESEELDEVVVRAKKTLVERRMDKIVMNVSSSPFAVGNNGKDILKKAPGVNIDRKGKVTVNGKAVEVYIDGRPSFLSGEQLKAMLEGTDGSTIDKIEIITQPSAKYDAAGQGGIINIKTKRNLTKGLNGSLSAGYGGMYWRELQRYMQDEHFSLALHYRGSHTYTSVSMTQQFADKTETSNSKITTPEENRLSFSRTRSQHQYYTLKLSNDWYIDSVNTIGFIVSTPLSIDRGMGLPGNNYSLLYQLDTLQEKTTEDIHTGERWLQHTANINYTHIFDASSDRELTLNLDYNRNNNSSQMQNCYEYDSKKLPFYALNLRQDTRQLTDIYSARLDFETDFWKTGKIECGGKWLTTRTGYLSNTDTLTGGTMSSNFHFTENIGALYLTMGKQFGEHWNTKIGLRGEYTHSIGHWLSTDSMSTKNYFNLFPTVFVGYMPTEDWSLSVDYTRRIQRPWYGMLDPSIRYEDAHSYRVGNTELQPAFTHNVLFSFGYSEYVSLDFNFAHTTDWIDYQTTVLPGGDRIAEAMNYGTNTSHGIFLSLTEVPIIPKMSARDDDGHRHVDGAWLAFTAQAGANHEAYHSYDKSLDMKHWSLDIYAEINAYLPKEWTISIDGYFSTPGMWGAEMFSSWTEMNFAIKKDFPKEGLTLTARVNDLMLSSKWGSKSLGLAEGYTNTFNGYDRAHMLSFGLVYKFGATIERQEKFDSGPDSDRLSESGKRKRK